MLGEPLDHFNLLLGRETGDSGLDDGADAGLVDGDERLEIHKCKEAHDELAIHPIRHSAVSGYRVAKVLDVERALQTRGEETAERRDQAGERAHHQDVELQRGYGDSRRQKRPIWRDERDIVSPWGEHGVRLAFQAGENVRSEVVNRADEVFVSRQDVCQHDAKNDGADPSPKEA